MSSILFFRLVAVFTISEWSFFVTYTCLLTLKSVHSTCIAGGFLFGIIKKSITMMLSLSVYMYLLTAFLTGTAIADAAIPPMTASGRPFVSTTVPRNARSVCEPSATAIE